MKDQLEMLMNIKFEVVHLTNKCAQILALLKHLLAFQL